MTVFNIKAEALCKELNITIERLYEIVDFFDSDTKDEWELVEGRDFKFVNKTIGSRCFSEQGAYAIAKYLDSTEKKGFWKSVKEFITGKNKKILNKKVQNSILQTLQEGKIIRLEGRHFIPTPDVKSLLGTSYPRLHKSFKDIQQSDNPLAIDEDYKDIDGVRHFSLSGFTRISGDLGSNLTVKSRRDWCNETTITLPSSLKVLDSQEAAREKRIKSACDTARKRDGNTCQITGDKPSRIKKFNLATHHLFSKADYPNLEDSIDNLITMKEEIHQEFHSYMGGNQVKCTIDDLIKFIIDYYPECELAIIKLNLIKIKLGR